MPESSPSQLEFSNVGRRRMVGNFEGGELSSDGGLALLREADRLLNLLPRAAACFADHRNPAYITHSVLDLVRQRVYGLCAGYEDLIDHDRLRTDPLLELLAGRTDGTALGSPSTLCRLENSRPDQAPGDRYRRIAADFSAMDDLLVQIFLESHPRPPERIVLDVDATDIELHGKQERRFWHGYYDSYCYLPLYVFCGQHLLLCRLRSADRAPATDAVAEIAPLLERIRAAWPGTRILLRGDADFGRDPIMSFCEESGVDFVFGLARNPRLQRRIARPLERSRRRCLGSGKPSRRFVGFGHQTLGGTWTTPRRVVGKAEYLVCSQWEARERWTVRTLDRSRGSVSQHGSPPPGQSRSP